MPNKMRRCGVHVVRSDLFTTALQYTQYIYILYIYVYVIVLIAIARRTTKQISMPVWRLDLVSALQDLQSYGFAQHVRSIIA
jgi:hypothetical protein